MNETRVECLTPPGSGAIATIAVTGPEAWAIARRLFQPVRRPLPEQPQPLSTWFGRLGEGVGDEVIVAVLSMHPEPTIEIHCHGGRQVVRWLIDLFKREGCIETNIDNSRQPEAPARSNDPWQLLQHAKTLRTAAILLDQANGAFDRSVQNIQRLFESGLDADAESQLNSLRRYISVGRHLLEPWKVVIAGAPNAGKSSLLNALAGYQRSVVAPVPGTTRDVVSATLAFDGWLVEISDTAGLRDGGDALEKEGIERARREMREADLCLWVIDATVNLAQQSVAANFAPQSVAANLIQILNKTDIAGAQDNSQFPDTISISALTGHGLDELVRRMIAALVPDSPAPGSAVPYSIETCEFVEMLWNDVNAGRRG